MSKMFKHTLYGACFLLLLAGGLACKSSDSVTGNPRLSFALSEAKLKEGGSGLDLKIQFHPEDGDKGPFRLELIPGPHLALDLDGVEGLEDSITGPFWIKTYQRIRHISTISLDESSEYKGLGFILEESKPPLE